MLEQLCRTNVVPTAARKLIMLQYHEKTNFNYSVTIRGADPLAEISDISLLQRSQSHWLKWVANILVQGLRRDEDVRHCNIRPPEMHKTDSRAELSVTRTCSVLHLADYCLLCLRAGYNHRSATHRGRQPCLAHYICLLICFAIWQCKCVECTDTSRAETMRLYCGGTINNID